MTRTLNKANYEGAEFGLSPMKQAESGNKYYWVLIYPKQGDVIYCATSQSFTALLGENADDKKLAEVIKAHQGEFEVADMADDAQFDDGTPIMCIRKRAHRVAVDW